MGQVGKLKSLFCLSNGLRSATFCSVAKAFESLRVSGRERILNLRKSFAETLKQTSFSFRIFFGENKAFTVYKNRRWGAQAGSGFVLEDDHIKVETEREHLRATVTLGDDQKCKMQLVGGAPMEFWQFRRRTLEDLFFGA